jgi:hypothetical protein
MHQNLHLEPERQALDESVQHRFEGHWDHCYKICISRFWYVELIQCFAFLQTLLILLEITYMYWNLLTHEPTCLYECIVLSKHRNHTSRSGIVMFSGRERVRKAICCCSSNQTGWSQQANWFGQCQSDQICM